MQDETMQDEIIELTQEWGAKIIACTNAETVCDGRDTDRGGMTPEEVTVAAIVAGDQVLSQHLRGEVAGQSSTFADWHGGRYCAGRASVTTRYYAAEFFRRDVSAVPIDREWAEVEWSEWEWESAKKVPAVIRLGLLEILYAAENGIEKELGTLCESD